MAQRLAWAIALSASAHGAVLTQLTLAPSSSALAATSASELRVRLAPPADAPIAPSAAIALLPPPPYRPGTEVAQAQGTAPSPSSAASALPASEVYYAGPDLDERAIPLNEVDLRYPEAALSAGTSGSVKMRLLIDSRGVLKEAAILESTPPGIFDEEALRAVRELRFRPAVRHGAAVGSIKLIEIPFYPDCLRTGSCSRQP